MFQTNMVSGYHANLFLRSLGPQDIRLLTPRLTRIDCACGETLATDDADDAMVYFPETVLVGMQMTGGDATLGLIGREGLVGWGNLLSPRQNDLRARVLMGGGSALVISVARMRKICFASPTLTLSLPRFVHTFNMQMSWSVVAARSESLSERVCGLLLMIHDRIGGDEIPATHRAIAAHLGVRRASVTDTLHLLEGEQAVRNERGRILVRNRGLVETFAGASYGARSSFRRRKGPFAVPSRQSANGQEARAEGLRRPIPINAPADRSAGSA